MRISLNVKTLLILIILFSTFTPWQSASAAATKTGVVDLSSGTLNIRSGPGINYQILGSLKDGAKVKVYSQTKSGWSEIRFKNKKSYVSSQYLRFYQHMSLRTAETISDQVISLQRKTWKDSYTKKQIYSIMSPGYTTNYVDQYFKQQFRLDGKDKYGTQLYHVIETEIWGYSIDEFDWNLDYQTKKPHVTYYRKNGKSYLLISQFLKNEAYGDRTSYLYMFKSSSKANWKVYNYKRKFHD